MSRRGGPQRIPRPPNSRQGDPAPWVDLAEEADALDLATIRERLEMAPPPRSAAMEGVITRASAVLAPLYESDDGVHVVLTRRAWHMRTHTGEVSFPGGGKEDRDPDLVSTALRETREEIGIAPEQVEIIGELDHLSTVTSRSVVVPYVGALSGKPETVAEPNEVDEVLYVPLKELLLPDAFREELWTWDGSEHRPIFFFELVGDTVWGATASMLRNLFVRILAIDP